MAPKYPNAVIDIYPGPKASVCSTFLFSMKAFVYCLIKFDLLPITPLGETLKEKEDGMAYNHIEELPAALKNNLPKDAMEVYVAAYNQAWTHSTHASHQRSGISIEDIAHRKAW